MMQACMAAGRTVSLFIDIDDVAADRSIKMDSEVYRSMICSHSDKCYKTDTTELHRADEH